MPISTDYCESGHVIRYVLRNPLDRHAIFALFEPERAYRDQVAFTVHVLCDLSALQHIPARMLSTRVSPTLTHPRRGLLAVVGASPLARMVTEDILTLAHFDNIRFFDTQAEALGFLRAAIAEGR